MNYIFLSIIGVAILLSGCQSQKVTPKKKEVINTTNKLQSNMSKQPLWINNPDMDGYIGAVGIVKKMSNKKKEKYIAKKIAISKLQEKKRVLLESKIVMKKSANSTTMSSSSNQEITQKSSHYKSDTIVFKDEYSDKDNYYVWMVKDDK